MHPFLLAEQTLVLQPHLTGEVLWLLWSLLNGPWFIMVNIFFVFATVLRKLHKNQVLESLIIFSKLLQGFSLLRIL